MLLRHILPMITLGVSLVSPSWANAEEPDVGIVISNVIEGAIRPGFSNLSKSADTMASNLDMLCANPGERSMNVAQSTFHELVERWGHVEMIRLGPLASENRLERLLFWPDRRGRGLNQVRNIIRTNDTTAQNPETLAQKSVAVQGLLALEFALFGSGFEALNNVEGSDRCNYASAISANIANIASEAQALWIDDDPMSISSLWQNPSESNPLFRDGREQLSALFNIVGEEFEIIGMQRLDPFLRDSFENAKPKSALFWRSGNTVRSLSANIDGLEKIISAAGLENTVSDGEKRIFDGLFFEFGNAKTVLAAVDKPTSEIAQIEADYSKLNYARIVVSSMNQILREQLSPIFNLSSGFSSLDGD